MKRRALFAGLAACVLLLGGYFLWGRFARAAAPAAVKGPDPNQGELHVDFLLSLPLGRDMRRDPQVPELTPQQLASAYAPWIGVDCVPPKDSPVAKAQAEWPEALRPRVIFLDKATRRLIGGMGRSKYYVSRKDVFDLMFKLVGTLSEKTSCRIVGQRQSGNRLALDYLDKYGNRRVFHLTSRGNARGHWVEVMVFEADSCLARDRINDLPAVPDIPAAKQP